MNDGAVDFTSLCISFLFPFWGTVTEGRETVLLSDLGLWWQWFFLGGGISTQPPILPVISNTSTLLPPHNPANHTCTIGLPVLSWGFILSWEFGHHLGCLSNHGNQQGFQGNQRDGWTLARIRNLVRVRKALEGTCWFLDNGGEKNTGLVPWRSGIKWECRWGPNAVQKVVQVVEGMEYCFGLP